MMKENDIKALWLAAKNGLERMAKVKDPTMQEWGAFQQMRGRFMALSEIMGYDENFPDIKTMMNPKRKPDIEYGITDNGLLKIWCNCKKKPKGSIICEDCAEYFTDKVNEALQLNSVRLPPLYRNRKKH